MTPPSDYTRSSGDDASRAERVRAVVEECVERRRAGAASSDAEVLGAHPDLLPELADELAKLARIERARVQARHGSSTMQTLAAAAHPPTDDAPPPRIPGYDVLGEIHRGGQGIVFRALQHSTRRIVALKLLRSGPAGGARDLRRFEREVYVLGQLQHPNIVAVHDSGVVGGDFYYAMDYIAGEPLDRALAGRERDARAVVGIFATIAEAVHAAHLQGVIHRDLKPANIRVDLEGRPHVLDFGLAKLDVGAFDEESSAESMTQTGQFVGSLPWASPEQVEGGGIDLRTDVYALGVMFYQALTGRFPYEVRAGVRQVMQNILAVDPAPPRRAAPWVDSDLATVILTALRKAPSERYQSAGELAAELRRWLAGEPIRARPTPLLRRLSLWARRNRALAAVSAAALLALSTTIVVAFVRIRAAQQRAEERATLAREQFDVARSALDRLVFDVTDQLDDLVGAGPMRDRMLDVAHEFFDQLPPAAAAVGLDVELGPALGRFGDVLLERGEPERGAEYYARSLALAQAALASAPADPQRRRELGHALARRAAVAASREARLADLRESERLFGQLHAELPDDLRARGEHAEAQMRLARVEARAGLKDDARSHAIAALDTQTQLAAADSQSGQTHTLIRMLTEAAEAARKLSDTAAEEAWRARSVEEAELLAARFPDEPRVQVAYIDVLRQRAERLLDARRADEALQTLVPAEPVAERLLARDPLNAAYRRAVILAASVNGAANLVAGRADAARQAYERALALARAMFELEPASDRYRLLYANLEMSVGHALAPLDADGALERYRAFLELSVPLLARERGLRAARGFVYARMAEMLRAKQPDAARAAVAAGIAELEAAPERPSADPAEEAALTALRNLAAALEP